MEAYVTAYGVQVKNPGNIEQLKSGAASKKDLCKWMAQNYKAIEDVLFEFYKHLKEPRTKSKNNFPLKMDYSLKREEEKEFLKRLGMFSGKIEITLPKKTIRFLTGDWLSDYCFNEISGLPVDDCVTGIELISPKGVANEFDVMFTKDNALYIVECKSLQPDRDEKYQDFLYKISALQQDFGLKVDGFMIITARSILSDNGTIREDILQRAEHCKTKIIPPDKIDNVGMFIKEKIIGLR